MAQREGGVAREKNGPQTAERHGGYEEERMCPLWAGRRPSGYAALRRRMRVMGEFGSQRCKGSARARPRGWWGGVLYRMVVDGELGRPSKDGGRGRTRADAENAPPSRFPIRRARAPAADQMTPASPPPSGFLLRLMSLPPDARPSSCRSSTVLAAVRSAPGQRCPPQRPGCDRHDNRLTGVVHSAGQLRSPSTRPSHSASHDALDLPIALS